MSLVDLKVSPAWAFVFLVTLFTLISCSRLEDESLDIPHYEIQNDNIQKKQDISSFFDIKTILVSEEAGYRIPNMALCFEYIDSTLFLINFAPVGSVIALGVDGTIKWDMAANDDPLTAFSTLSGYFFDRRNKVINIFDTQKNRVYQYDFNGIFLGVEKVNLYMNDVFILEDGTRLFSTTAYRNEFEQGGRKAALVSYNADNKNHQPDSVLLWYDLYNPNSMPFLSVDDLFTNDLDDRLYYRRNYDDTIFQIKDLVAEPFLTFSFTKGDRRREIQTNKNGNPMVTQQFLDENVPYADYIAPVSKYLIGQCVYNGKYFFTMIDMESKVTVVNASTYSCNGIELADGLNYSRGMLLNQMYAGDYFQLNEHPSGLALSDVQKENIVYNILTPKW